MEYVCPVWRWQGNLQLLLQRIHMLPAPHALNLQQQSSRVGNHLRTMSIEPSCAGLRKFHLAMDVLLQVQLWPCGFLQASFAALLSRAVPVQWQQS